MKIFALPSFFGLSLNRWRVKLFHEVIVAGLDALLRREASTQLVLKDRR
jgi:hypothetical protein